MWAAGPEPIMMTLECMVRGFGAVLPRGAENVGRFADGGVVLGWKVAAAARVREKLERSGREEKRLKVLENRMMVVGWDGIGWVMGDRGRSRTV